MNYPSWWNKCVTLYNKSSVGGAITWHRTVLCGCFVKQAVNVAYSGDKASEITKDIVRIRKSPDYLPPYLWQQKGNKNGVFTIQCGDIIVFGNASDEIDEYSTGKRASDFIKAHEGQCMVVTACNINDYPGLPSPHYKIVG